MGKVFFNTLYYVTIAGVGLVGLLLVATLMPIPGNWEVKVVKSGSMEPTLQVGSVVVIRSAAAYGVGDVITFGADTKTQIPTTHRIVGAEGSGAAQTFTTKGDANEAADQGVVRPQDIHGKMVFSVPYLGYILAFARTTWGFLLLVGLPALLVFFEEGKNIFLEIKKMRRKRHAKSMPVPIKAEHAAPTYQEPAYRPRIKVMSFILVAGLLGVGGASAGLRGSTVAYYADTATSFGNMLGAAADFGREQFLALTLSEPELVSDEPLVLGEQIEESATPEALPEEEPTEPAPLVELGEVVIVDTPVVETPVEGPPTEEAPPVPETPQETPPTDTPPAPETE